VSITLFIISYEYLSADETRSINQGANIDISSNNNKTY